MDISRRKLVSTVSLFPLARLARAAQVSAGDEKAQSATGQQNPTFSTDVKVVNIFATVRDKKGQIVKGLKQDDFALDEEGRPQTIRYFSQENDLPLTLGLLVDTSGSQRNVLGEERSASYRFFDQILREDRDQAFLIHFDFEVELLQDLTSSRVKLEKSLDDLQVGRGGPQGQQGGGYPGGGYPPRSGGPGGRRRGGTSLYDGILLASDEIMRKQKGRKALVVLTDGVDNGSKVSLPEAIGSAQRADTLVYSVLFADQTEPQNFGGFGGPRMGRHGGLGGGGYPRGGTMNRPDGKKVLEQISQETGGRFFEVSHKEPITKVYADIEEDLRNQYNIGYTPERADTSSAYRHIHLTTKQKDLKVQAREGYYPS